MKRKKSFLVYCFIASVLLGCGCANGPDDVAISSDGIEISFDQQGTGNPTIIFIHGWANNKGIWDAQMSYFSPRYRVVAVDLPGFGESGFSRTDLTSSL
jgi:pimeloyl-ACP methyl ester carboxylesterase